MDVFAEAEGLKRRRALLEQLQSRALTPQIQGGRGHAIGQLLASLGTSALTSQGLGQVDQARQANSNRYGAELSSAVQGYLNRRQGTPETPVAAGLQGPPQPAVPGDPRRAMVEALSSRFPEMQAVGKAGLSEMMRKPAAPLKPDDWKIAPDGTAYRTGPNGEFVTGPKGMVAPQRPVVNIENYPKAAEKTVEKRAEAYLPGGVARVKAEGDQGNLSAITEALGAIKAGASTGTAETYIQVMRKLGDRLGIQNAATIPTDQLEAALNMRVFQSAGGKLGGNFSNTDLQFLKDSSGSLSTNPQALKRILALATASSVRSLNRYNNEARLFAQKPGFEDTGLDVLPINFLGADIDPEFDQMLQRALAGKPTVDPAPGSPAPKAPSASPAPVVQWGARRGR